jgi:ribosomal protein S4
LRTYYNIMSKRFLKDLYIKAKKKNIQKSFWLRRYIEYKLDSFLVNIWFFKSIFQARQYITHGKVYIENTIITNSSYIVTLNKLIELKKNTITNWKLSNIDIKKFFLIPNSTISYSWVYYFLLHLYNLNYSSVKCTTYFLT